MALYRYKALNARGELLDGQMEAASDADVAARASAIIAASNLEIAPVDMPANFYAAVAAPRPISTASLIVHTLDAVHLDLGAGKTTAV